MNRVQTLVNARFDSIATGHVIPVLSHEDVGVSSSAKEAIAFALLGYMTYHRIPNNVPACTGATQPVIMGKVCYAT